MKTDQNFITEIQQFERFFTEVFNVNDHPAKPLPTGKELVIDGPARVFDQLPLFRFTRRSKKRQEELGETGEFQAYCTPGDAKILKEDLGYDRFQEALKKVEFSGFKDIPPDAMKDESGAEERPEYFIPGHPKYTSDDFSYVWRRAQRCCPYIVHSAYGAMQIPAPMYTDYMAAMLSLSQQGYDVTKINVFRALLREAKISNLQATHIKDIVQLYGEQEVSPDFDVNHADGYEQYPEGNKRHKARDLFEFIECLGEGHLADFKFTDVKKYAAWWAPHRALANEKQRHKKRKNKKGKKTNES